MEKLLAEVERYRVQNKGKSMDSPLKYLAAVGVDNMTTLVKKAKAKNKIIRFTYAGRKLTWKLI